MTYQELINNPRSKKNILCMMRSKQELKFFTSTGGNNYEKATDFFAESMTIDGVMVGINYDVTTKKLSFSYPTDPSAHQVFVTYKHLFSNFPLVLPHDLGAGGELYFEPRISDIGELKLELDYENTGIALESSSSISLENNDGYFDDFFDTHIWENQAVEFYYYFEQLPLNSARLIYKGLIENKSFNPKQVKFSIKDRFYSLRNKLNLPVYELADGSFDSAVLGRPKRRLYGEFSKLKCPSIDQFKGEFSIAGTISGASGSSVITGISTEFLKYVTPGDVVTAVSGGATKEISVASVDSDTQITTSEPLTFSFSGVSTTVKTDIAARHFNRRWSISGHELFEFAPLITNILGPSFLEMANTSDFEVDDLVEILGSRYVIRSIFQNKIRLNQTLDPAPAVGDSVLKVPCFAAYYGTKELVYTRDFTLENNVDHAILVLNDNCEENIFHPKLKEPSIVFTNGSRVLTSASDLRNICKPRDMIKPSGVTYANYYEILSVDELQITLRTVFTDATITQTALVKEIDWVNDDSIICVDCIGKGDTKWLRYASDIVKDIIVNDAGESVNAASFNDALTDAGFKLSAAFPLDVGNDFPVIKDCISDINKSVFGSVYYDGDYNFKYSILNSNKSTTIKTLKEDDVLSYDSITKNNIINVGVIEYKPETSLSTGEVFTNNTQKTSEFVNRTSGIKAQKTLSTLIFNESDALLMLNRYLFFNSLTNSIVKIKAKLNLSELNLNDPVQISFDRIYKRYGGKNKTKIGIVNLVSKDDSTTTIQINDVSGIFNRVPSIAPNTLSDIGTTEADDIAKFGFIVDNINETPDNSEEFLGANLIG